jgi:recombinational DNA repair protein (RecF pathway)
MKVILINRQYEYMGDHSEFTNQIENVTGEETLNEIADKFLVQENKHSKEYLYKSWLEIKVVRAQQ